jgi:hypothetical protein
MAQAKIRMMPGRRRGLSSFPAYNAKEKSSATFAIGAPVKNSAGYLVDVGTANKGTSSLLTYIKKSSTANVFGISMGKARASHTSNMVVATFAEGMEFVGNLVAKSASSAKISKIGSTVYMAKRKSVDTHWGWTLDTPGASSASYVQGKITQLIDPKSTVNGRVCVAITKGGALGI